MTTRSWLLAASALVVLLLVASVVALFFIDEPLRRYTEAKMNASLEGYTVSIRKLHFSPINFSLDLRDTVIVQDQQPDPPVANIERLYASVHWRALLSARVVGDILIEHPVVVLNLRQARAEINDPTPVRDKGWQHALQAIYPLKINELRIHRGDITYQDDGPFKPLRVHDLEVTASNIRNVHSERGVYPSPMTLRARVFDAGAVSVNGWADFLAEPYAAFMADITLDTIALDYFKPITNRYNLALDRGTLSADGEVQIAPQFKSVKLWSATVDGIRVDYIHTPAMAGLAQAATREAIKAADRAQDPGLQFRVDRLDIVKSTVGFVNKTTTPSYRISVTDTTATLTNLSSLPSGETAVATLRGKFMGSGPASADFKLQPTRPGPDFDLAVQIDGTDLTTMNDLLRAHGKFASTTPNRASSPPPWAWWRTRSSRPSCPASTPSSAARIADAHFLVLSRPWPPSRSPAPAATAASPSTPRSRRSSPMRRRPGRSPASGWTTRSTRSRARRRGARSGSRKS
jgi:hypothetical protein